jgi:hypothetical protein
MIMTIARDCISSEVEKSSTRVDFCVVERLQRRSAARLKRQQQRNESGYEKQGARNIDRHRSREIGIQRNDGSLLLAALSLTSILSSINRHAP